VTEARRAFEWYLGRNDLGMALYDAGTGGCRDGLHMDRLSQNEGAESTLAFLLALSEMKALQNTLASFKEPADLQDEAAIGPPVSPEASGKQLT
jgi:hypothetical protein